MSLAFGASTVFMLLVILIFVILFFAAWLPLERGREVLLRPLRSLNKIREMNEQAAETGTTVHFSPGTGGLSGQSGTAEALNGLTTLSSAARYSARSRSNLVTTTNDSLTYLAAEDTARVEYIQAGRENDRQPEKTRFVTQQDRMAYTAGVNYILSNEKVAGSVMIGRFSDEYLLAGDTMARRDISQVVGSTQVEALPLMAATAGLDNVLIGEEVYAAPAYLDRQPAHLASLLTQDRLRLAIIVIIIAGVIAATLGVTIGDYFLR
jgi:hypothetical protein